MAKTVRELAERLVALRRKTPDHSDPATAKASDFAQLDRRAYDRFQAYLKGVGYRFVADYTNPVEDAIVLWRERLADGPP